MSKKNHNLVIKFKQARIKDYALDEKNSYYFSKLMVEYGLSKSNDSGYCYGISNNYLLNAAKNQGENYINHLNTLLSIINSENVIIDPIEHAKYDALKIHAKIKLNALSGDILKMQFISKDSSKYYDYLSTFSYHMPNNNHSFFQYVNEIILNNYVEYKSNANYRNKESIYYKGIYELQKIKIKKYMKAILANKDFFKTPEGKAIATDQLFIELKNKFKSRLSILERNFTYNDAMFFINVISGDIYRDNYLRLGKASKLKGLDFVSNQLNNPDGINVAKDITLNSFIENFFLHVKNSDKSVFYQINTNNHTMAISVNYDTDSGTFSYSFFDPNMGIYKFKNEKIFIDFFENFIIKNNKIYDVMENKYNEYVLDYIKFNFDRFSEYEVMNSLNEQDIRITTNTLLAERKITEYLGESKKNKFTYKDFNPTTGIVKVKVTLNKKSFYIYSDILDNTELKLKIKENLISLAKIKSDIFLRQETYQVYAINKKFNLRTFNVPLENIDRDYKSINLHLKPKTEIELKPIIGIPKKHQKVITQVANEYNIIIGVRPIDYKSTSLIESGEYSSKGLSIKGKSADWGPHCGFIPIEQQFSKSSGREEPEKYNAYIQQSIKEKHAIAVTLEITPERVNELIRYKTISPLKKKITEKYSKTTSIIDGKEQTFFLKKVNQEEGNSYIWQVHYLDGTNIKPFQVIGDPKTKKAMTADYDLFSIIYPVAELDKYVKVTEMPTWTEWKSSIIFNDLTPSQKNLFNNEADYNKREGKDNGIINDRIKEINNKINQKLKRSKGFELVHHGADDANPVSVMKDNFPITFFLPDYLKGKNALAGTSQPIDTYFPMNGNGAIIIKDAEQLSNFQQLLINQGYRAPLNKKWSEGELAVFFDPKRKLSDNFLEATKVIQRKKSIIEDNVKIQEEISFSNRKNNWLNKDDAIEKILGKPIARIDPGYDNISIEHTNNYHAAMLAGEHSTKNDPLDTWQNPIINYQSIKENDVNVAQIKNISNYDYNIIIQLEGDEQITRATARIFSKDPENSMVIQYNLKNQEYKVLYGDTARARAGKVRWITVSHGYYQGNNHPTIYAGSNAQEYADSLAHLKKTILKSKNPDKLVLMGCQLARGSVKENFALQAVNELAKHDMKMPIVAYNRMVGNDKDGHKFIKPYLPYSEYRESTRNYKFVYQIDPVTQKLMVNNEPAALYFIKEIRRLELKVDDLFGYIISDPLAIFKNESFELDINRIKLISYNSNAYNLFIEEMKSYNLKQPSLFYAYFTEKLKENSIKDMPIWKAVDIEKIQQHTLIHPSEETSSVNVIVRLVGDENSTALAEKLASENPKNTFIFQMDTGSQKIVLEYGNPIQLHLLNNHEPKKWILLGDSKIMSDSSDVLALGLRKLKEKYALVSPENIVFNSADISQTIDIIEYEAQLHDALNKQSFSDFELSFSATVFEDVSYVNSDIHLNDNSLVLEGGKNMQIKLFLEQIALKNVVIENINLSNHHYLNGYFTNTDGSLNSEKLKITLYDPLISPEVNKYLSRGAPQNSVVWNSLFDIIPSHNLQTQARDIQTILLAINNDPSVIHYLGETSAQRLSELFPAVNGFDHGEVLALVSDPNAFSLMSDNLNAFCALDPENFVGEFASLKGLSLAQAMQKYDDSHKQIAQQYNQLINQSSKRPAGSQVNLINHGMLRQHGQSQRQDEKLGLINGLEFFLSDANTARDLLERKSELVQKQQQGQLLASESELLNKLQQYTNDIDNNIRQYGITLADQSILTQLMNNDGNNNIFLLKSASSTFTLSQVRRDGFYEYSLFDPNGLQLSVKNESQHQAKQDFHQIVKTYLNEEIKLPNGHTISRGKHAGFAVIGADFRADIQTIDLDNHNTLDLLQPYMAQRKRIFEHSDFTEAKNSWVSFYGEKIPLSKLQHLGVTIDGKPITSAHIKQQNWHFKTRFNAEKLASELTLMDGSKADLVLLKILGQQLNDFDDYHIASLDTDFHSSGVLKKQLKVIREHFDAGEMKFTSDNFQKLRKIGTKLPRYQRIANRFGQGMGGAGAIQTIIGIYAICNSMDNPDLTTAEYAELEKQFYLSCASAFFNYGDMMVQPILSKLAFAKGTSQLGKARLASGVMVVFNLAGMGVDAYQAYDNLSKLSNVTDPKQRQDLIVNASFSIVSFVVNGVTVVGVIAGSSMIPAAGLVIGGFLIVGGWIYNGRRAVENIKAEIDISWSRELEEGIRGAVGLEPTQRSQQEMIIKRYIDGFKKSDWEMDLEHFEKTIMQAGFDHHLSVIEKPKYKQEQRYYLVDNMGNHFGGTLGTVRIGVGDYRSRYTKRGAPSYSSTEADWLLKYYLFDSEGNAGRSLEPITNQKYQKKPKDTFELKRTGSYSTNEGYSFNHKYQNPLFTQFKVRHNIKKGDLASSTQEQLGFSHPERLSFFSKKTKFGVLGQSIISGNYQRYSEHLVDDKKQISLYLNDSESRGTSFNSANGNDVIIGKKNHKNAFQVFSGEKFFVGGEKDDYFYLRDSDLDSLKSRGGNEPTKYLDGQLGLDTLIIDNQPKGFDVYTNLSDESVYYQKGVEGERIHVAHIQHIENIIIRDNSHDQIQGNDANNILDGGLGKDTIYGNEGDDRLILTQGYANGGMGNDSYHIRRYEWINDIDSLYLKTKKINHKTKSVEPYLAVKSTYLKSNKEFHAQVSVEENTQSLSVVTLEYSLNEIVDVYIEGDHLYLKIQLPTQEIDGHAFTNVDSQVTIELKNIYLSTENGRRLNHAYQLKTLDGFMLTSQLNHLDKNQSSMIRGKFFNISYLQHNDQLPVTGEKSVRIDEDKREIIINHTRVYYSPEWGQFIPIGHAENLTYQGSDANNLLSYLKSGSHIQVSCGVDSYQINQVENNHGEIIFDFSAVKGRYTEKDKLILLLPTENGYLLQMDGQRLRLKDKFGSTKLTFSFENFDDSMREAVIIQDQYSNLFTLNLEQAHSTITPVYSPSLGSNQDDTILLPEGYFSEVKFIDGNGGNDIIINNSHDSYVLIGGEGNDSIKARSGNNVLYGGSGINFISGGNGDDLLLSSQGDDSLMGGKGNDHYLIDGQKSGVAYIEDNDGKNHIHLIDFNRKPIIETEDNETVFHSYLSTSGKIVKIKQPVSAHGTEINVHHYSPFIDKFQPMTTDGMKSLALYLAGKLSEAQARGQIKTWLPANEMSETLNGLPKRLNLTPENNIVSLLPGRKRTDWLIDALQGDDLIADLSLQGRIIKGNDKLIVSGGENVLYAGKGNDVLMGGERDDVLISSQGKDHLAGGKGNDFYLVNGHDEGDVTIYDVEGRNKVVLINFMHDEIKYVQLSEDIIEVVYQAERGRKVTIHHNNHKMSMANVMSVSHYSSDNEVWNSQSEHTIDKLIQLLAEQRIEHESSFSVASNSNPLQAEWGVVQLIENFLNHAK